MERFIRGVDWFTEHTGQLASYLVLPLIATIVYSVIVRYYFGGVVHWAFEMSLFFNGILVLMGGAYALKHKSHVRVDVLADYLGNRGRFFLDILSFVVVIMACVVIIYLGTRSAWTSTLRLERSSLQTPFNPQIWWFKWMIPLSALLIVMQAVVEIIRAFRRFASDPQE